MSCNGCRVLRKGCKDDCILRESLQWIQNPQSQGYATLFVARFFGRAGLFSFISAVPSHQRPGLFQSLLFEAAGRTVNPVSGSTGLLWTGNWQICQSAVDTVLRGGTLSPEFDLPGVVGSAEIDFFNAPGTMTSSQIKPNANANTTTHRRVEVEGSETRLLFDKVLENTNSSKRRRVSGEVTLSDESETTTMFECSSSNNNNISNFCSKNNKTELKLLRLFV